GFPLAAKDIGTAFVQRGCELVSGSCGFVGSLTNRNYLNLPSYEEWRKAYLLEKGQLRSVADLGYGVLDDAVVEAAAYTLADPLITTITPAIFISCLDSTEKGVSLAERTSWFSKIGVFSGWPQEFLSMPSCVIAYTAPPSLRSRIKQWLPLKDQGLDARIGMSSRDDERFLRTAWEVQPHVVGVRWRHLAKGGEWSPFYDDIHLMLDWADNGRSLADSDATIRNPSYYFRPGLTYPERTTSGFGPRVMPRGCAFTTAGQAIFFENRQAAVLYLGLLLSRSAQLLIEIALGGGDSSLAGTAARHYTNGMINRLPFPHISDGDRKQIVEVTEKLIHVKRKQFDRDETSRFYIGPAFSAYDSLSESAIAIENSRLDNLREIAILSSELETLSEQVFGLRTDEEKHLLWQTMGPSPHDYLKLDDGPSASDYIHISESELIDLLKRKSGGGARFITKNTQLVDRRLELISHLCQIPIEMVIDEVLGCKAGAKDNDVLALITDIIAYGAGVALGRWDIRFATGDRQPSELPDPFDPLPVCPPGMLQGPDGLPAKPEDVPSDYPIRIDWDGILVDDLGHENDIVRRVRDVLEVIWKDRAEAIEREACEILGVRE
ncbi:MAG TPA: hypothetical protein PKV86_10995, partial [Syntrophobacteraceae bacterium]|nr:hypothetical protein [Syntrophobacteraceae bacterium]